MLSSHDSIKLLYITTVPETLGFLRGQVQYMQQRGFKIHALSSSGDFLQEFAAQEQITPHVVEMPRRITPFQDLIAILEIWRCLRQIQPHIVHTNTPKGGLLGTIAAWFAATPVRIYHMRGLPFMTATGWKRRLLRWSEKISCLLADQVICVSHSLREVAIAEGLCAPEKIKVLLGGSSNGVNPTRFDPETINRSIGLQTRQALNIPADALVVGFVGRIVKDKGITELAGAWKLLREAFPMLHLLLVGPFEAQDPLPPEVEKDLVQDDRVHLAGLDWNTPPFYAAMDILTLPTYREGFPNTLLEAAAMQLPVVATRVAGCVDAVEEGVTGLLVPSHSAEALADAMGLYLSHPELRDRHGRAGRARVLRDYCQSAIWDAVYQEYLRLLTEKGLSVPNPVFSPEPSLLSHQG
ncbi:glycosyltransferase family 4 protein [Egbenema bharatensis]|uniref:glycosyltransferase family 4 protein n=1 Tax=Egbenema bharatensis TaxID=3463334 RepID=UPI003A840CA0